MKAVLFDYNGTLYADDDINMSGWIATIKELSQGKLDAESFYHEYMGVPNYYFVKAMFEELGLPLEEEKLQYWARRKETEYYQRFCREQKRDHLVAGAEELLDYLKEKEIPINLCTASLDTNVDFYFEYLKLDRWFDRDKVVYDDGICHNKKEMYLEGAKRLNTGIKDILIFDDSRTSILQAAEAGCENIVAIRKETTPDIPQIRQRIKDFTEFDYNLLNS